MKKLGLLFATMLMIMLFAVSASAVETAGECGDGLTWTLNTETGVLVISGEGEFSHIDEPDIPWLDYVESIRTMKIGKGVSFIDEDNFFRLQLLENINVDADNPYYCSDNGVLFSEDKTTLVKYPAGRTDSSYIVPDTVTFIGRLAFSYSGNLLEVKLPTEIKSLGEASFFSCRSLRNIELPESLTHIGSEAFRFCSCITEVRIPYSVKYIDSYVFEHCSKLEKIEVDAKNEYYCSVNGVLFNEKMTELVAYPIGNTRTEYEVPESVTMLHSTAFSSSGLVKVQLPEGIKRIPYALFYCNDELEYVNIPEGVESIDKIAFLSCKKLAGINIPESVTIIADSAFAGCFQLFDDLVLPDNLTYIGEDAFGSTGIRSVVIRENVSFIGKGAFSNCKNLLKITVDKNNKYYANDDSGVLFNKNKKSLMQYPCGIKNETYTIPDGTNIIESYAFTGANNMSGLVIPSSVYEICGSAFYNYADRKYICYNGSEYTWNKIKIGEHNPGLTEAYFHYNTEGKFNNYFVTDATCTKSGERYAHCKACGKTVREVIPALGHSLIENTIPATCTEQGEIGLFCERCNYKESSIIPALNHKYSEWVIVRAPSCVESGEQERTCANCGVVEIMTVPSLGDHKFSWNVEIMPTCNTKGLMANRCEYCGATKAEYVMSELEHNYKNGWVNVIEPTCTRQGVAIRICVNCGKIETKELDLIPHADSDDDCKCDYGCGYEYEKLVPDTPDNCSCNCHKGGIAGFFFKIINFFQKLFGQNKVCACGVKH